MATQEVTDLEFCELDLSLLYSSVRKYSELGFNVQGSSQLICIDTHRRI